MIRTAAVCLLLAALSTSVLASTVDVRMVEASTDSSAKTPPPFPAELRDIQGLLAGNLAFNRYRLLGRGMIALPAAGRPTPLPGGYRMTAQGNQANLRITVTRGEKVLIRTTVSLPSGKPVIIGGFAAGGKSIFFVLNLR